MVNHIVLKVLAVAILASISTVAAAQQEVVAGSAKVTARAQPLYRLAPQEFYAYEQRYLLDNGLRISLTEKRHRYYTQLLDQQPVELYPVAPGVFVTALGTRLAFGEDGETVAITNLDRLPYAGKLTLEPGQVYLARR